ncbi:MAG: hypothetical protein QW783_02805 [Candidatus Micrarchaeia archaeon]
MDKKVKGESKLLMASIQGNLRISKKRSIVKKTLCNNEKRISYSHIIVTMLIGVCVRAMFMFLEHNLSIFYHFKEEVDSVNYKKLTKNMENNVRNILF